MNTTLSAPQFFFMLHGLLWTVYLTFAAFGLGMIGGGIVMVARLSPHKGLRSATAWVIRIIQGIPEIILLFLAYYGLSGIGLDLPPMLAASIAFMIYISVYLGEIWRGSVESIPVTQWEAAEGLSLTRWQAMRLVIVPQAIRISIPSTVGFLVQVLKSTSLASVISLVELTRAGQIINNAIFQPFLVFAIVGALYFILCYPLSCLSRLLERKLDVSHH